MEQTILKQRFPQIELSYETDSHKKVLNSKYDICVSIPTGKKYFAWFTHEPGNATDACYIIDKQGIHFKQVQTANCSTCKLSIGTIVYGTLCELPCNGQSACNFFVIEDIHSYSGISMKHMTFASKMSYIVKIIDLVNPVNSANSANSEITFVLPYMARIAVDALPSIIDDPIFYDSMLDKTAYVTHHVQFRASTHIVPHLNHNYKKNTSKTQVVLKPQTTNVQMSCVLTPRQDLDFSAASQKREAVFLVSADMESDIYHLHCYDNKSASQYTYVDVAHVGTYKESKYLNGLFRNIRENDDIDLGEESEDEDMFQNMNPDKYVDLSKKVKMNCVFQNKWRRWTPVSVVSDNARVVNIHELVKGSPRNEYPRPENPRPQHPRNEYVQNAHIINNNPRNDNPRNDNPRHQHPRNNNPRNNYSRPPMKR